MGYLDNDGLAHFWSEAKDAIQFLATLGVKLGQTDNLNSLIDSGIFYWDPVEVPTNSPINGAAVVIMRCFDDSIGVGYQICTDGSQTFTRQYDGSAQAGEEWGTWTDVSVYGYDSEPTSSSAKLLSSGAIYTALAAKVSSSDLADDIFGVGTLLTSDDNLNSLPGPGSYYWVGGNVPTNAPITARGMVIQLSNTGDEHPTQIVFRQGANREVFYIRGKDGSTGAEVVWGSWKTFECVQNYDSEPTANSVKAVSSGGLYTALSGKQDTLTFDSTPDLTSDNPVTSSGIASALSGKQDNITFNSTYDASTNKAATMQDIFGKGTLTSTTDDVNTLPRGLYYWTSNNTKPQNAPSDAISGFLINMQDGSSAYSYSPLQFCISTVIDTTAHSPLKCIYFQRQYSASSRSGWIKIDTQIGYDTTPTSGHTNGITSGAVYTAVAESYKQAYKRGTLVSSSTTSPADLNDLVTPGRYYNTTIAGAKSMLHTPITAGAISATDLTGGSVEIIVEDVAGSDTNRRVVQTYILSGTNATAQALVAGKIWKRWSGPNALTSSNHTSWTNWFEFAGTEIIPPASYNTSSINQGELMGGNPGEDEETM